MKYPHATEVDRRKEVLQVDIEDVTTVSVLSRVCNYRTVALKTMREFVFPILCLVDFIDAILQQIRKLLLQKLQSLLRGLNEALSSVMLGNFKDLIFRTWRLFEEDVGESGRLKT